MSVAWAVTRAGIHTSPGTRDHVYTGHGRGERVDAVPLGSGDVSGHPAIP